MTLQIPKADRKPLAKLLKLQPKTIAQLQSALESAEPRMRPSTLAEDLREKVDVDWPELRDVVQALATLDWVRNYTGGEIDAFVEDVVEAVERERGADDLKAPEAGWDAFRPALAKLLSVEALAVTAKALYVAYQQPRHFHGANVVTDARPVFGSIVTDGPAAFVVSHTLHITAHEGADDTDWYASLNSSDLAKLRKAIDRATEKEQSLRTLLSKTGKSVLEWEP